VWPSEALNPVRYKVSRDTRRQKLSGRLHSKFPEAHKLSHLPCNDFLTVTLTGVELLFLMFMQWENDNE
jgi:hypothetical protein